MPTMLTVRDESTTGDAYHEFTIALLTEHLTVRELIRSRVYQEVKDYNVHKAGTFRGLVQPTDAERELNGYRLKSPRMIDWKPQFDRAIEAFERKQVLVLIDDRQAASLDEEVVIGASTVVSFLKLTPLVGG